MIYDHIKNIGLYKGILEIPKENDPGCLLRK